MKKEANAATTVVTFESALMPVLSGVTSFSPQLKEKNIIGVLISIFPFLRRMKQFCLSWVNDMINVPYLAA